MTIEAEQIVVWVLVLLRTGAFFLGIPLFAGRLIPVRIRMAFGLLLSLLISPFVPADLVISSHYIGAILLSMNEICIGLLSNDGQNGIFCCGIGWIFNFL